MIFISFICLSIEDIAVQIEEPFSILPLVKCHKWLLNEVRRMRSLVQVDWQAPEAQAEGVVGDESARRQPEREEAEDVLQRSLPPQRNRSEEATHGGDDVLGAVGDRRAALGDVPAPAHRGGCV